MKKFVIGDIHGSYKGLMQCIKRSKFDAEKDLLIGLGDVVDGWPETKQCIEYLTTLKHHIHILGNHDDWALDWMTFGEIEPMWRDQGGQATIDSYKNYIIPENHVGYLRDSIGYHTDNNRLFVHGGFNWYKPIAEQRKHDLIWDRILFQDARMNRKNYGGYEDIFIGHSTTMRFSDIPVRHGNVWMLDQGAGYNGKLSIMDIDTKEFWQSDNSQSLYPDFQGR